jgi:predicted HD superfamily hydrolase involved in NAD metabolism
MEPILLHGPLAVQVLREQYKVLDADVLGAVAAHTTARPGMTPLQKLIFIADKIEPQKMGHRPEIMRVSDLAESDLDEALFAYLEYQIGDALRGGWPLHPNTIAARNELLARRQSAVK